jgi:hypothetical protein
MVNRRFPAGCRASLSARKSIAQQAGLHAPCPVEPALVQILPNLRSFKFSEKTALIRVEYGQKPPAPANPAFKPA